jgi:molybdopterin converting factor subunit 1
MRILLFAGLAEAAGRREFVLDVAPGGLSVAELEARLRSECPPLAGRSFRVAVNQGYAAAHERVAEDDEVALIPPVSGG